MLAISITATHPRQQNSGSERPLRPPQTNPPASRNASVYSPSSPFGTTIQPISRPEQAHFAPQTRPFRVPYMPLSLLCAIPIRLPMQFSFKSNVAPSKFHTTTNKHGKRSIRAQIMAFSHPKQVPRQAQCAPELSANSLYSPLPAHPTISPIPTQHIRTKFPL